MDRTSGEVRIMLEMGTKGEDRMISCVAPDERNGYLWIGSSKTGCYGVVQDRDVKRLHRLCERLLAARGEGKSE